MTTFSRDRSILFQRHEALLVTNNALRLMPGLLSDFLRRGPVRMHETIVFQQPSNKAFPMTLEILISRPCVYFRV